MSRLLGVVSPTALTPAGAVGAELLSAFLRLAVLHADGWGLARQPRDGSAPDLRIGTDVVTLPAPRGTGHLLSLRFASAGSPPSPENSQPFLRDGIAFAHNGLLAPRERLLEALTAEARAGLQGATDSEAYLALVLDIRRSDAAGPRACAARAASAVRARFPDACLNAMLLWDGALLVVHSRGTVPAPHAAFARRGLPTLPPGHDDEEYNRLAWTTRPGGAQVVATSGVDRTGWEALPEDSVTVFRAGTDPVSIAI